MKRILNLEYGGIFAAYWMFYGVVASFVSAFLLERGYSNSEIGVILAAASILSVFLQPLLADLSDRSKRMSVIGVSSLSTVVLMVLTVGLFIFTHKSAALWIVYVLIMTWVLALHPLFNSFAFKLSETGHHINFGVCRAAGSLGYAILVAVLGTMVENMGISVLPVTGEIVLFALLAIIILIKKSYDRAMKEKKTGAGDFALKDAEIVHSEEEEEINLVQFMKRNKLFVIFNIGIIFLYFQNYILNNYMLQVVEDVGGNAEDMGRVFSVMAFIEIPGLFFFDTIRKKISCQNLLKIAAVAFVLKLTGLWLAKSVTMIYLAHFFHLFGFPIFLPAMVQLINEIMAKGEAVKGQALYTAAITVSSVFSSLIGGVILDVWNAKTMLLISTVLAVIGTLFVVLLVDRIESKK